MSNNKIDYMKPYELLRKHLKGFTSRGLQKIDKKLIE